jgi:hypothetical protein
MIAMEVTGIRLVLISPPEPKKARASRKTLAAQISRAGLHLCGWG